MKKFLTFIIVLVVGFLAIAAMQPDTYRVERSLSMNAAPAAIYAQVIDLHKWDAWSPWAKVDPNAKVTYEGPAKGKGASMHWEGNNEVGVGTMTVSEVKPNSNVKLDLNFEKPMKGTATSEFTFEPEGKGTKVTWAMYGTRDFMGKIVGLLINCDKMIGDQYEKGLASLKEVVKG